VFKPAPQAVFLSDASQDAGAALRLGAGLRAAGVEVWLDQEGGLVGGDAWDRVDPTGVDPTGSVREL